MSYAPENPDELFVPIDAEIAGSPLEVGLSLPRFFPPPTFASPDGLVCVGGRLEPDWLLDAYRHGIFPWPVWDDEPMAWWSLDPRAILELDSLHISRRLRRTLRSGRFQITCDRDFEGVIRGCATAAGRRRNTWLTSTMIEAYLEMHRLGHAHSVEAWCKGHIQPVPKQVGHSERSEESAAKEILRCAQDDFSDRSLAGGVYGVAVGGLFAAESMFYRVRDASKVALVHLVAHLRARGYRLLDIQQWTPHTGRMGAVEIPRMEYLRRLAAVVDEPVTFGDSLAGSPVSLDQQ